MPENLRPWLMAGTSLSSRLFFDGEEKKEEKQQEEELSEDDPRVQKIVKGLKAKNAEVIGKNKEIVERLKAFEGLDPDEVKAAVEAHRKSKDKQLLDEGKVEELIQSRTERMRADYEASLTAKDKKIKELEDTGAKTISQLNKAVLGSAISNASLSAGIRPEAIPLVEKLAGDAWKVEDGQPRAYDSTGPIMGKDTKPIQMKEWVEGLRATHGYLFKESYGGDAGNDSSASQGGGDGKKRRGDMTVAERSAYVAKHGREAYLKLPA